MYTEFILPSIHHVCPNPQFQGNPFAWPTFQHGRPRYVVRNSCIRPCNFGGAVVPRPFVLLSESSTLSQADIKHCNQWILRSLNRHLWLLVATNKGSWNFAREVFLGTRVAPFGFGCGAACMLTNLQFQEFCTSAFARFPLEYPLQKPRLKCLTPMWPQFVGLKWLMLYNNIIQFALCVSLLAYIVLGWPILLQVSLQHSPQRKCMCGASAFYRFALQACWIITWHIRAKV